ncbi:MAG: hypothetical protein KBS35_03100 [Mycoplasma sp.]|nr:hypothetical protein [Candidatus Hennigella equi]
MKRKLIPIITTVVALPSIACAVSCSTNLSWSTLKDGTFEKFKPKGKYADPLPSGTEFSSGNDAWEKYFSNKEYKNMLANDVIYATLAVYASTPEIDLKISVKINDINQDEYRLSYSIKLVGGNSEAQLNDILELKNVRFNIIDAGGQISFTPTWLSDDTSPEWQDKTWSISLTHGDKYTINSEKKWSEIGAEVKNVMLIWSSVLPYYLEFSTLAK